MTGQAGDPRRRLVAACRILEMEGHGDLTLGHVSARDPDGRGFWLKRNAIGLGEVCGPHDLVLLDTDTGAILEGSGGRHSEWHIHAEIYRRRPEIACVAHTHPKAACRLSALEADLAPATIESNYFALPLPRFTGSTLLIKTPELGAALAAALGDAFAVLMVNHGVTFCGRSVEEATMLGVWLEGACRAQLALMAAGAPIARPSEAELETRRAQILTETHLAHSWAYLSRKLAARHGEAPFHAE